MTEEAPRRKRSRLFLLVLPAALLVLYLAPQNPVDQGLRFETSPSATEVRVEVVRAGERARNDVPERTARLAVVGTAARYDFRAPKDTYVITAEALGPEPAKASITRTLKLEGNPVKVALIPEHKGANE